MTKDPLAWLDHLEHDEHDPRVMYPGSRRVRKGVEKADAPKVPSDTDQNIMDPATWGYRPLTKKVNGYPITVYTHGALASALQRPVHTLYKWERNGYLPHAPFKADHIPGEGGRVGRRYFTVRSINAAQVAFMKRGLFGASRIQWSQNADLTAEITEEWEREVKEFMDKTTGGN